MKEEILQAIPGGKFESLAHTITIDFDNERIILHDRLHDDELIIENEPEQPLPPNYVSLGLNKKFNLIMQAISVVKVQKMLSWREAFALVLFHGDYISFNKSK